MDGSLTPTAFLELLAREAPTVEFEEVIDAARSAGAEPATLAELDRAKRAALRVQAILEQRRRRETELAALFETASDLAALRDLDAVLDAIVRRARALLGTDIAYLTLIDPDRGDTYMRSTDGSVSGRFQRLRLTMGTGLGGLVAQTATPHASVNYLTDDRYRHAGDVDEAVREEGIVAILGVPLRRGQRVIGVLFAADRAERTFAPEEVALLGSLAAHAVIAIDSARLLDETRLALAEFDAASALVRAHSAAVERAADAHDRLAALVLRGGGVEDVATAVTEVLGGSLLVAGSEGERLAAVGAQGAIDGRALADALAESRAKGRAARRGRHWVVAVVAGSQDLGALVLERHEDLSESDARILERAGLVTALLLLFRRSLAEAENQVRGELLADLLSGPPRDPTGLRERARRMDVDVDAPHAVVVARADGVTRQRASFAAARLASSRHGLSGDHDGAVVLLLPGGDPGEAARWVSRELGLALGVPVTAGGAGPAAGLAALAQARAEAARCVAALAVLGRQGEGAGCEDLGYVGLLLAGPERGHDVQGFVGATIGEVVAYDARRGTELVQTLEGYFGNGASLARTAEALHVHVNTVTQRLDRIGQLVGHDWQQPARALEIQLALRLHRLSMAVDADR